MNMKRTIIAASIVSFAIMAGCPRAHAESWLDFEGGLGMTNFITKNGRWYQENMPDDAVVRDALSYSVGVAFPLLTRRNWGIDGHIDYVDLGRDAASCYCTPIDGNYNLATERANIKTPVDDAYFSGSGRARGVTFTVEPYYRAYGVRFAAEAGAYVYRGSWNEYVSNWSQNMTMAKQTFSLSQSSWAVAPVAGVSIGYGHVTLSYRHYFMAHHSESLNVPPVWNDANMLELKVRF
jgi:hypothetical protein